MSFSHFQFMEYSFIPEDDQIEDNDVLVPVASQTNPNVVLTFENITNSQSVKEEDIKQEIDNTKANNGSGHVCNLCDFVFHSVRTLQLHQTKKHKLHKKAFIYGCDDCDMKYAIKSSLVTHRKRKHGVHAVQKDEEVQTCDICALVFRGKWRLRLHKQRKHGAFKEAYKFKCRDCDLRYDNRRSLKVHRSRKHNKARKKKLQWYNCSICPKVYNNRDTYVRHLQRKHQGQQRNEEIPPEFLENMSEINASGEIPCKECPMVFSSMMYLKLHMRRKHNAYIEDFRLHCKMCKLSYDKLESLKRHVRRKHLSGVFCDVCGRVFESQEAFGKHSHEKPINECEVCGLIFVSQGGLRKHMRCTHKMETVPNTVFCTICKAGFHENRQLKVHLMKVHLNVTYTCKFCEHKTFKSKESYRKHVVRLHSGKYPKLNGQHDCDVCSEQFATEHELCKHRQAAHNDDIKTEKVEVKTEDEETEQKYQQTFQCTKCTSSCSTFEELRRHYEQNHHQIEKTQCQVCGELIPVNELPKHMKSAHPVDVEKKCSYCDFKTKSKASLTQHTLRHKNATSLQCEYPHCRYNSYFPQAMEKHKKKHNELGVKMQCAHCSFQCMNKYILKYHEEAHTTGKKKYQCNECDYSTILPANLIQHKYKHATVKRFKCEYCSFATKYNTSLRFHVRKKHCDLADESGNKGDET